MERRVAVGADINLNDTWRNRYGNVRTLFQNANRARRKPAAFHRCAERQFAKPFPIRRIGEQKLKGLHWRGWPKFGRVAPPDLAGPGQSECLYVLPDRATGIGIVFDEEAIGRAPRQRFKTKRAGACEKVEHARALDAEAFHAMREDIEKGLAHTVRRGARDRA